MTYLLDTDVVIYHLNGVHAAHTLLLRLREFGIAMSAVSYMEAVDGLVSDPNSVVVRQQFDDLTGLIPVLPFSIEAAEHCARIRANLRRQGRRVRPRALDLMIAATALVHDMTLVTNNPNDYDDLPGLNVEPAQIVSDG